MILEKPLAELKKSKILLPPAVQRGEHSAAFAVASLLRFLQTWGRIHMPAFLPSPTVTAARIPLTGLQLLYHFLS
jgi:hypothetical protein